MRSFTTKKRNEKFLHENIFHVRQVHNLYWQEKCNPSSSNLRGLAKPGLHKPQLPVERSVTLVSSIVAERRRCALKVGSVARLQENKEM